MSTETVESYLRAARESHLAYRHAAGRTDTQGHVVATKNHAACRAAILEALTARAHAERLDPLQTSPAWSEDAAQMRVPNAALVVFYDGLLAAGVCQ